MMRSGRPLSEGFLFTDQYQLTMAQLYFRMGWQDRPALFEHFFRSYPDYGSHQAGYCVNAGLAWLLDWMESVRCGDAEIAALRGQRGRTGAPLFADDFLSWLREHGDFAAVSMRAIPEGRVVHPGVPLTTVQAPLPLAQILESPLLAILNYQILIATRAARMKEAGGGRTLLEFGMRRGHGIGVNAGARAALIGGADFTSNVGISHELGLPPQGTHAHSLVQVFLGLGMSELDAFRAFAELYPDDCVLLVDTVNTLQSGVPNAIRVFEELRRRGHRPLGIRLDSGDLAYLGRQAARQLDAAGFTDVAIVLSNQLDEPTLVQILGQIREECAAAGEDPGPLLERLVYGIGTRLIVSEGHAALDGVYKLVAVREGARWSPALKISENPAKVLNPGEKDVWRLYDRRGKATADVLTAAGEHPLAADPLVLHHAGVEGVGRSLAAAEVASAEPLLEDVLRDGRRVADLPDMTALRERVRLDLERLDPGVRRLVNPHTYHVSITDRLWRLKRELVARLRR
ncbi:MAG: nicotinate phosphoribosyltransferase [Candidatus Krumholzibacteriia bacterium]